MSYFGRYLRGDSIIICSEMRVLFLKLECALLPVGDFARLAGLSEGLAVPGKLFGSCLFN